MISDPLALLRAGEIRPTHVVGWASNDTYVAEVRDGDAAVRAIYKPREGEAPLWDFPDGTLWRREVAAYEVSEALGWSLVPPTVAREDGPLGPGSLQLFVDVEPEEHYATLRETRAECFRRVAAFDVLVNNADRKSGHCLLERATGRIWCVDHGICFHREPKLRTVIWEFAGKPIPGDLLADVARFAAALRGLDEVRALLAAREVAALGDRARAMLAAGHYPDPGEGRPFPWPPV